ncbi:MAG: alpha/beta hydrolase, partial [Saprospiraceae bacterium]|nr:alpha/beta hydrolase [Saprospiraceae bacterium]
LTETDLVYAQTTDGVSSLLLDVYYPMAGNGHPVLVLLHGGSGDRKSSDFVEFSSRLAEEDVVVFNVSAPYRGQSPQGLVSEQGLGLRSGLEAARCAVRYARQQAGQYGGDGARITIVGQSAGGVFGALTVLGGEEILEKWEAFEATGGPADQVQCVEPIATAVQGFVGFNGAYFVFNSIAGLPEEQPELWDIINLYGYIGNHPTLAVRFLFGNADVQTPGWHIEQSSRFIDSLQAAGYDADTAVVSAGHNFNFQGAGWDKTLEVVLSVVRR